MPFYNFHCKKCNHEVGEKLVNSFDTVVECPKCNEPMDKGISKSNFIMEPTVPRGM